MISSVRFPTAMTYRVEVSGWDAQQKYFVTKADLQWFEDNAKQLVLSCRLGNNPILFVRLLNSTDQDRALPVPYQAEYLEPSPDGAHRFRLRAIRSKVNRDLSLVSHNS